VARENEASIGQVDRELEGGRVLVTGASGNIGRAIALRCAAAGARVIVHYLDDADGAAGTCDAIAASGGVATTERADLADAGAVDALFDRLVGNHGQVTHVVNNAARQPVLPLADMDAAHWREVMETNLDGAYHVSQAFARHTVRAGGAGAVVNVASIEGLDPAAGHAHYATSKAGLLMLTRACAMEYGGAGIRFNAVSPGLIDRDGLAEAWPDGVERWLGNAPLGSLGRATDVAEAVLFLLGPRARWITGANLVVDGGMSATARW